MHNLRKQSMRWVLVSLLLPGYLLLLTANKETDGGFALWLDLTLDTSLGKSISTGPEGSQNTLLIGEWKQYRQVNTSTTPAERPEIRDVKLVQRSGHAQSFDTIPADARSVAMHNSTYGICDDLIPHAVDFQSEPMESGLAIGAP